MSLKDELRQFAFDNDMDYFGVGSTDRFTSLPVGHRPTDLLPRAKSVIVMGMRIPDGAINASRLAFTGLRHAIFSYTLYGYNKVNEQLDLAALRIVFWLEKNYQFHTYPIPAGIPRDEYLMMGAMSNRYAAVCCGLGEFGWSGFVLTPHDGPRVRWVTIITDAELEPDPLYQGPVLCDRNACDICVQSCPAGALSSKETITVKIGDLESFYGMRNKPLCRFATSGLLKGTPGRLQAEIPPNFNTVEQWLEFSIKDDPWQRMEFSHGNYCHRCLIMCPVGLT